MPDYLDRVAGSAPRQSRRSGGRQARANTARKTARKAPFIQRNVPYLDYLSEEGLARIEDQADWLLQEVGIEFRDDPRALEIWRDAGATVKGTRVHIPTGMTRKLLETAPEQFTFHSRNPAKSVEVGGRNQIFGPVSGPPFAHDLERGRRYATRQDFEDLTKLVQSLDSLHMSGFWTCEITDVPVNKRHLDMVYTHLRYSDKPHLGAIISRQACADSIAMARIAHGKDALENGCYLLGNVNPNSPLLVDKVVTEAIYEYSGANQGIVVVPFILGGAMGPVSTAASVAQAMAEAMACGAFSQLVRPGAPFVLGNFLSSMSLRTGAPTFGTPEPVASNYVVAQLARRLKVPLRCGGALTASKLPDAQAAAESADSMHSTAMAGANFVLQAAGWLEGGLSASYEKLVLDADRLGGLVKLLGGMETDDNALGRSAYDDVEPGGHFLGSSHTMANYETAYYENPLSDNRSVEQWADAGSPDAATRATARWKKLLAEYERPQMDEAVNEELLAFMAKRRGEMPDAWY
ncbi:MAG: trimethylamine methyltransferase family protein [Pseudomonadota bacterium]